MEERRLGQGLLTLEGYATEIRDRETAKLEPIAGRLARLAAAYVKEQFGEAVRLFRFCAATTRTP